MWKLSSEAKADAVSRYIDGESCPLIAARYGVSDVAIRRLIGRRGIDRRAYSEASAKHSLRHDAFSVMTDESAYWCGFLAADGALVIRANRAPEVALVLANRDRVHLEKFRDFLGSSHAITAYQAGKHGAYQSQPAVRFSVRSAQIVDDLRRLCIKVGPLDRELANSRHFWRGVVDGDGWVGVAAGSARLELVGPQWLLEEFVRFLAENVRTGATARPHKSIYRVQYGRRVAEDAVRLLYGGAHVGLDRKINAAKNILAAGLAVLPDTFGNACGGGVRRSGATPAQSPVKQETPRVTVGIPRL